MKRIEILIGNIGAGKSTYCRQKVKEGYIVLSKDSVRYMFGAGSYVWNEKLELAIHRGMMCMLAWLMSTNADVIIDETNMDKKSREEQLHCAVIYKYKATAVIFPKFSKEVSVGRRLSSNHGDASKEVWEEVWERKNSVYEKPTYEEGFYTVNYYHKYEEIK